MRHLELSLVQFFERVARRDPECLAALQRRFALTPSRWTFMLRDLHSFLKDEAQDFAGIEYPTFRRCLHKVPINQALSALGAGIVIVENSGKVDRSVYAMVWHDAASGGAQPVSGPQR